MKSETQFQIDLFKALSRLEATHKDMFTYAVEFGENNTNYAQLRLLKAKGMRRGISDLHIIGGGKMLFVELKSAKGGQSDFQKMFQKKAEINGFEYLIFRSSEDVKSCVMKILQSLYN